MFERADNFGCKAITFIGCNTLQHLQTTWALSISGIEVHNVTNSVRRNLVEEILGFSTVWINEANAFAVVYVSKGETFDEG